MSQVSSFIHAQIAEILGVNPSEVSPNDEFISMGLDSMHAVFLIDEIEKKFGIEINPHSFWEHPTINSFAANLEKQMS